MKTPTNEDRADRASIIIGKYLELVDDDMDHDSAAGDLIADIMHHLKQIGYDPNRAVQMGITHFEEECDDEDEEDGEHVCDDDCRSFGCGKHGRG